MSKKSAADKKTATIGIAASQKTKEELEKLAEGLERSASFLAGKFMMRGWEAFRRDGLLDEPPAPLVPLEMPARRKVVVESEPLAVKRDSSKNNPKRRKVN